MPDNNYICPRCNYNTEYKKNVRRHLHDNKKTCPNNNDLELTDEIREIVLRDRKYHPPKKVTKIVNYNTLNKIVIGMDFTEKMEYFLEYGNKKLLDFEDDLEDHFEYRNNRLVKNIHQGGYFLTESDFVKLIDDVTKIDRENVEKFNIFYQKTVKRFQLYRGTSWESYIEEDGARELVSLIKSYYLDNYESYIIRHLHGDNYKTSNRIKLTEHLIIYYRFISAFDLRPFISDQEDQEILGHRLIENNTHHLAETYMKLYVEEKNSFKISEKNRIKRKIINTIKENTMHNISELNHVLSQMLQVDDKFREQLINNIQSKNQELL